MASDGNGDDYGHDAYLDIMAELDQWDDGGSSARASTTPSRRSPGSPGLRCHYDETPAKPTTPATRGGKGGVDDGDGDGDGEMGGGGAFTPSYSPRSPGGRVGEGPVGVQTPEPPRGHAMDNEWEEEEEGAMIDNDEDELIIGDGTDPYRPYHDAFLAFLRDREEGASRRAEDGSTGMQVADDDDGYGEDERTRAADYAELKFLDSLAVICLSRGKMAGAAGASEVESVLGEASRNEGNFWDLLRALREGGASSLFYCVDGDGEGEEFPDLTLAGDPSSMIDLAPADALDACLGGEERNASPPLARLNAALGWIEACHARRFEEILEGGGGGFGIDDPVLPPPRRRTMWPGTVAALKRQRGTSSAGAFHPDAPLRSILGGDRDSPSTVAVSSFLAPQDEEDDARLLRACFMLFQAGRVEDALRLVDDCGQPWRAASWIGGEPLSADGGGNPARALWKGACRKISKQMARVANAGTSSMADNGAAGTRGLYPSVAYEAAILSLLSDDADAALANPVFGTWEDGVHAVLRSEMGIVEDDVLRSHGRARAEAAEGRFPYPGAEFEGADDGDSPRGYDGDLGAALRRLEGSAIEAVREGGGDPLRNGMASFLAGGDAPAEYIEECAALSLESADGGDGENYDGARLLRFATHLLLYADAASPEFCSRLALPPGMDDGGGGGIFSLRELLVLKYVAHLSSRRELWPHVALYASLLSDDHLLDTYSSFLLRVHGDRDRRLALDRARDLFPAGMDRYILRNVVRAMVAHDDDGDDGQAREPGEEPPPAGVTPADARRMRSVLWLCYHPEHMPDALVAANMLLRRFLLSSSAEDGGTRASDLDLYAPKVFVEKILPKDLVAMAMEQCVEEDKAVAGSILSSPPLAQNLEAEFASIDAYLKAHTKYAQFLDAIAKTSPCHKANKLVLGSHSKHEADIADKMERNAFRQKKVGLCKIIIEFATRASDALSGVLTFGGGWLLDVNTDLGDEEASTEEAKARSEELDAIRSKFVPRAVFMLREVLDKTATWLEQIVYDTLVQFGSAGRDMLLSLFDSFDEIHRFEDDLTVDLLTASRASPGYWHKKALSLASTVANEFNCLHGTFSNEEMERFLSLTAESHLGLQQSLELGQTFVEY